MGKKNNAALTDIIFDWSFQKTDCPEKNNQCSGTATRILSIPR